MRALLLLALVASTVSAQDFDPGFTVAISPFATPFLPLSTEAQAVAEAGAFGRAEDPLRLLDNPALLADFSDGVRVSGHLMDTWLGVDDLEASGGAIAGGLRTRMGGVPATVGVGLAVGTFSQPPVTLIDVDGTELATVPEGGERVLALGVGMGLEGPVRVRLGGAVRSLRSQPLFHIERDPLGVPSPSYESERATAVAADLGLDVTAPFGRWLRLAPAPGTDVVLDVTLGYALRGIAVSGDAPPGYLAEAERQPTAGAAFRTGLDVALDTPTPLRAVEAEYLTGAEDPGADAWGNLTASHVLLGQGDTDLTVVHRAARMTFGETLTLSRGAFEGANFVARESWGLGLSTAGALRLVGRLADRPDLHALGSRFDLRYTYAEYEFDPDGSPFGTAPAHGVVLRVRP